MMWRTIVVSAALPAFLVVACGGKSDETPPTSSDEEMSDSEKKSDEETEGSSSAEKKATCEKFCDEIKDCEGVDASECVTSCADNTTTSLAGQEAFSNCFNASLCESEDQTELLFALACLPSQLSGLDLSQSQKDYCEKTVPAYNACAMAEPTDLPFGDCEDVIGAVSDETLEAFNECTERECGSLELCVTGVLLQSIDLNTVNDLDGGNVSPEALTSLLTIGLLASQLGSNDTSGGLDFGDLFGGGIDPDPPGSAGAGNN